MRERNEPHPYIYTILIIGLFAGGMGIFYFGRHTLILIDVIALIVLAGGFLAMGIHYLLFRKWQRYFIEVVLYSFFGWGSIICATFLALNFLLHKEAVVNKYKLASGRAIDIKEYFIKDNKGVYMGGPVNIKVDDQLFDDYPWMLSFEADEIKSAEFVTEAWFTIAEGLFGYKILLNKELH